MNSGEGRRERRERRRRGRRGRGKCVAVKGKKLLNLCELFAYNQTCNYSYRPENVVGNEIGNFAKYVQSRLDRAVLSGFNDGLASGRGGTMGDDRLQIK